MALDSHIGSAVGIETLEWHPHWDVFGLIAGLAVLYEMGLRSLADTYAPRGEPAVTGRQRLAFYTGLATMAVVTSWPFHDLGEQSLFLFHMGEHLTLALIVPPLLLWGTPWWLLRVPLKPILPFMRLITKPLVALFLFNATLGLLHAPGIVELMVTNSTFHLLAHLFLFLTAIIMWFPVMGPIPDLPRLEPMMRMGYLFLQSLVPTIPASFLTLGETPLYKIYETFPRMWGISAHTDQVLAGFLMKFGGGLILWGAIAAVFFTWYAEEQKYGPSRIPAQQ